MDPELLRILRCPLGKAELKLEDETLVCTKCGVVFQIIDDIPVLIMDEAKLPDRVKDISELKCQREKQ
jgi:uncharacterized protein YbaR (Trm112 family)